MSKNLCRCNKVHTLTHTHTPGHILGLFSLPLHIKVALLVIPSRLRAKGYDTSMAELFYINCYISAARVARASKFGQNTLLIRT